MLIHVYGLLLRIAAMVRKTATCWQRMDHRTKMEHSIMYLVYIFSFFNSSYAENGQQEGGGALSHLLPLILLPFNRIQQFTHIHINAEASINLVRNFFVMRV